MLDLARLVPDVAIATGGRIAAGTSVRRSQRGYPTGTGSGRERGRSWSVWESLAHPGEQVDQQRGVEDACFPEDAGG